MSFANIYSDLGVTPEMMHLHARKPIFVELFCGTKSMSDNARLLDYFQVKTLDLSESVDADYKCDIMDVDDSHALSKWIEKKMKRGHIIVMHSSPPCDQFSTMNTRGIRDIDGAMMLVKKAHEVMKKYSCVWTLENPNSAFSLWTQQYAIDNFNDFHVCDYCAYGHILRKSTRFVFSHKELADMFTPKRCSGESCASVIINPNTGRRVHASWEKMDNSNRIHIPQQLCYSLLNVMKTRAYAVAHEIAAELEKNIISPPVSINKRKWDELDWGVGQGDIVFSSADAETWYSQNHIHYGDVGRCIQIFWVVENDFVQMKDGNFHVLKGYRYFGTMDNIRMSNNLVYMVVADKDIFYLLSEPSENLARGFHLTPKKKDRILKAFKKMN